MTDRRTSSTRGISSTREMSVVPICGEKGKPRSAITRLLVWRTRLSSELIWGFRIPVLSISSSISSPDLHAQRAWHLLLGRHDQIATTTSRVHSSGITGLKIRENVFEVDVNRGMPHGVR